MDVMSVMGGGRVSIQKAGFFVGQGHGLRVTQANPRSFIPNFTLQRTWVSVVDC